MKSKLFLLGLIAALSFSSMQAQEKVYVQDAYKTAKNAVVVKKQAVKANLPQTLPTATLRGDVPEGMTKVTLSAGDIWQDGSGYQMLLDADATAYGTIIPETGGLTSSGNASAATYAEFEYKIPENADGNLNTSNIVFNNSISIMIPAGTYDWCITNPTPGDRMWIASSNGDCPGRYDDFVFQGGVEYIFTITFDGYNDGVSLTIPVEGQALTTPEGLAVEPTATTAAVVWEDNDDMYWNLRYRPYVDPATVSPLWDLPIPGYEEQVADWMVYDADGDGFNWELAYSDDTQTDACFMSESYSLSYWMALTPDNWLITPAVGMGGTLKFKTWNYSSYYVDKIAVYVCPNEEWTSVDDFILLQDNIEPGTSPEEIVIDLSAYEGMGHIAFRHYDCEDEYSIYVDDVEVLVPGAQTLYDWIYVYDIADVNYLIEGLDPETEYEVQVQATGLNGTSDWTPNLIFKTLGNDTGIEEVVVEQKGDNNYYNLMGQKMNGNNLPAGIYIHNGKKIVVK